MKCLVLKIYNTWFCKWCADCVLYRTIRSADDVQKLQKDIKALQRWEKDWLMEFHPQKCHLLHITNRRSPLREPCNIHGHVLEEVDSAKYLGVNIHRTLNWTTHIDQRCSEESQHDQKLSPTQHIHVPVSKDNKGTHSAADGLHQLGMGSTHYHQPTGNGAATCSQVRHWILPSDK